MRRIVTLLVAPIAAAPSLASPEDACPPDMPASLAPPADQRLRFVRAAVGVQVYVCTVNATGAHTWLFIAPEANLYKPEHDKLDGTHSIGPVWQDNDGSAVKMTRVAGATVDPTAIQWLLLRSVGNVGPGKMAEVSTIQRLNIVGGLAPAADACNASTLGTVSQVPYTIDYFFYDTHTPAPGRENPQCR